MKSFILITLLICLLPSCKQDDKFDSAKYPQEWQLVKMTGQIVNSETKGAYMEWQESYLLNSDGTFTKSRKRNGIWIEESGRFEIKEISDETFLDLTYDQENEIIGSCFSNQREQLWLRSEHQLSGTWENCDGPGLDYERVR